MGSIQLNTMINENKVIMHSKGMLNNEKISRKRNRKEVNLKQLTITLAVPLSKSSTYPSFCIRYTYK